MFNNKKGGITTWVLGYLLFNMLYTILLFSFAYDDTFISQQVNMDLTEVTNSSITSEVSYADIADIGFWNRFKLAVFDGIPWWMSIIFATYNGIGLMILIYGMVRGLS